MAPRHGRWLAVGLAVPRSMGLARRLGVLALCAVLAVLGSCSGGRVPAAPWQPSAHFDGPGFTVHFAERQRATAGACMGAWFDARRRVESFIGLPLPTRIQIEILPDAQSLEARARALGAASPPPWAAGLAFPNDHRVLLSEAATRGARPVQLRHLLTHELTHLALAALREDGRSKIPLWLEEGLAQLAERRPLVDEPMLLARAEVFGRLPPLSAYAERFPADEGAARVAYAASFAFVERILSHHSFQDSAAAILEELDQGAALSSAYRQMTGSTLEREEVLFRQALRRHSGIWAELFATGLTALAAIAFIALALRRSRARRTALYAQLDAADAAEQEPVGATAGDGPSLAGEDGAAATMIDESAAAESCSPPRESEPPEVEPKR